MLPQIPTREKFAGPRQTAHLNNYRRKIGSERFEAAKTLLGIRAGPFTMTEYEAARLLDVIRLVLEGGAQ